MYQDGAQPRPPRLAAALPLRAYVNPEFVNQASKFAGRDTCAALSRHRAWRAVRSLVLLAAGTFLLAVMARVATAQPAPAPASLVLAALDRPVEVELRSAARAVAPGDTVPVAIRLRPDPGWHTYWRHAGDVGSAPVVTW
ncbi:MAG TPA: hypothetical protein VHQ45_02480, partial [Gemmatimonadaceae bacterium]|nr:hypothetical protein [Gemmatimonadaceae bacterium]